MRSLLLACSAASLISLLACSSTEPSGTVVLTTNAPSYVLTSNTPAAPMFLTLRNNTPVTIESPLCNAPPLRSAQLRWEQQQPDGSWLPGPFAPVVCVPAQLVAWGVPSLSANTVPPGTLNAADTPGTYRIKLGWAYPGQPVGDTAVSNSYVVTGP